MLTTWVYWPDSFGFVESVSVLAVVIIGGVGSVWAFGYGRLFKCRSHGFQFVDDYKLLLYSALLFMMRFSPEDLKD